MCTEFSLSDDVFQKGQEEENTIKAGGCMLDLQKTSYC
jgi:hypothetical protein